MFKYLANPVISRLKVIHRKDIFAYVSNALNNGEFQKVDGLYKTLVSDKTGQVRDAINSFLLWQVQYRYTDTPLSDIPKDFREKVTKFIAFIAQSPWIGVHIFKNVIPEAVRFGCVDELSTLFKSPLMNDLYKVDENDGGSDWRTVVSSSIQKAVANQGVDTLTDACQQFSDYIATKPRPKMFGNLFRIGERPYLQALAHAYKGAVQLANPSLMTILNDAYHSQIQQDHSSELDQKNRCSRHPIPFDECLETALVLGDVDVLDLIYTQGGFDIEGCELDLLVKSFHQGTVFDDDMHLRPAIRRLFECISTCEPEYRHKIIARVMMDIIRNTELDNDKADAIVSQFQALITELGGMMSGDQFFVAREACKEMLTKALSTEVFTLSQSKSHEEFDSFYRSPSFTKMVLVLHAEGLLDVSARYMAMSLSDWFSDLPEFRDIMPHDERSHPSTDFDALRTTLDSMLDEVGATGPTPSHQPRTR